MTFPQVKEGFPQRKGNQPKEEHSVWFVHKHDDYNSRISPRSAGLCGTVCLFVCSSEISLVFICSLLVPLTYLIYGFNYIPIPLRSVIVLLQLRMATWLYWFYFLLKKHTVGIFIGYQSTSNRFATSLVWIFTLSYQRNSELDVTVYSRWRAWFLIVWINLVIDSAKSLVLTILQSIYCSKFWPKHRLFSIFFAIVSVINWYYFWYSCPWGIFAIRYRHKVEKMQFAKQFAFTKTSNAQIIIYFELKRHNTLVLIWH